MSITELFKEKIEQGWTIESTSCACGGLYAWLKPRPSGAMEMVGCICHTRFEEKTNREKQLEKN